MIKSATRLISTATASALLFLGFANSTSVLASAEDPGVASTSPQLTIGRYVEALSVDTASVRKCLKQAKTAKQRKKCRQRSQFTISPIAPPGSGPAVDPAIDASPNLNKGLPSAPDYAPVGNPASYSFVGETFDGVAHWDYCTPIKYRVNPTGMSTQLRLDIDTTLGKVSAASGLKFEFDGETDIVPFATFGWDSQFSIDESHLIIATSTPEQVPALSGYTEGIGGSTWVDFGEGDNPRYFAGGLVIDRTADIPSGFVSRGMGVLLLHEMGHVVGLGHVDDTSQIMHPLLLADGPTQYQAGDLAGFASLASHDCFDR